MIFVNRGVRTHIFLLRILSIYGILVFVNELYQKGYSEGYLYGDQLQASLENAD